MKNNKALYQIIYENITNKINNGTFPVGSLIPSEIELETTFQTSRTPVRQALKQLENDGYIYRLQGKGSFVSNRHPAGMWTLMTGFRDQYSQSWKKISVKTLEAKRITTPEIAQKIFINKTEEVIYLKRIRFFNGEPVVHLEHFIAPQFPLDIFTEDPTFLSVGQVLKDKVALDLNEVIEEIEVAIPSSEICSNLKVEPRTPLLKVTRISYDIRKQVVDLNVYYVRTDQWKYVVKFQSEF
jgi:GntR family transcriptional regulator